MEIKTRRYRVVINFVVKTDSIKKGLEVTTEAIKIMGLDVVSVKHISDKRSDNQNNALHLWLSQIADEAEDKGLTIDRWIKRPTEFKITKEFLKDTFRMIGEKMYGRKSTADLEKDEFAEVHKLFDKAVLERLGIDIPFPNIDLLMDKESNY